MCCYGVEGVEEQRGEGQRGSRWWWWWGCSRCLLLSKASGFFSSEVGS